MIRLATLDDIPALRELIPLSVRELSRAQYSTAQIESAIRYVFGPDTQLINDGSYFVVETEGQLVGCGGWSRRRTLYGGDQMKPEVDPLLDPLVDAARLRAFFVHPSWARRGIASQIMRACLETVYKAGFQRLELVSTLSGVPLYRAFGFNERRRLDTILPDGTAITFVQMEASISKSSS